MAIACSWVAKISSREGSATNGVRNIATVMISGIAENGILPCKNAATATSLAAFIAQAALPPRSRALRAMSRHGKRLVSGARNVSCDNFGKLMRLAFSSSLSGYPRAYWIGTRISGTLS